MSAALLRQSLELVSYETDVTKDTKDKRKKKKTKSSQTLDLIPVNHRLISKNKKNGSKTVLKRSRTITVSEVKKQLASETDPTEENIQRLLMLSSNRLDSEISDKILYRAVSKRYTKKQEKPVEEESTVFTEEDFKKFEAEYIGE